MEPKLKWIPMPLDGTIHPPLGLTDFQVGWFWNLFWASLTNPEFPGYLPAARSTLWTFAGAHRRAHWDANCALVMAAFELREIAGRKMWCLPALVNIIEEQKKKLRAYKKATDFKNRHSGPQEDGTCSPSQFGFDFDIKKKEQVKEGGLISSVSHGPASGRANYSQADFDARDQRRMAEAYAQLNKRNAEGACWGSGMSTRQMFEYACGVAGISIARGLELEEGRRKWPEQVPDWAKEEVVGK
jgi:hypothetical protein